MWQELCKVLGGEVKHFGLYNVGKLSSLGGEVEPSGGGSFPCAPPSPDETLLMSQLYLSEQPTEKVSLKLQLPARIG